MPCFMRLERLKVDASPAKIAYNLTLRNWKQELEAGAGSSPSFCSDEGTFTDWFRHSCEGNFRAELGESDFCTLRKKKRPAGKF
jgi:hypothetical protein